MSITFNPMIYGFQQKISEEWENLKLKKNEDGTNKWSVIKTETNIHPLKIKATHTVERYKP
ncbi:MAG: hypothetical protein H0W50_11280, partial [Parachlamydiaceae bacterium]|nr:hypothetical protein [Parachlamydiaceae bacterium]